MNAVRITRGCISMSPCQPRSELFRQPVRLGEREQQEHCGIVAAAGGPGVRQLHAHTSRAAEVSKTTSREKLRPSSFLPFLTACICNGSWAPPRRLRRFRRRAHVSVRVCTYAFRLIVKVLREDEREDCSLDRRCNTPSGSSQDGAAPLRNNSSAASPSTLRCCQQHEQHSAAAAAAPWPTANYQHCHSRGTPPPTDGHVSRQGKRPQ